MPLWESKIRKDHNTNGGRLGVCHASTRRKGIQKKTEGKEIRVRFCWWNLESGSELWYYRELNENGA